MSVCFSYNWLENGTHWKYNFDLSMCIGTGSRANIPGISLTGSNVACAHLGLVDWLFPCIAKEFTLLCTGLSYTDAGDKRNAEVTLHALETNIIHCNGTRWVIMKTCYRICALSRYPRVLLSTTQLHNSGKRLRNNTSTILEK